jgi:hypothetical protein
MAGRTWAATTGKQMPTGQHARSDGARRDRRVEARTPVRRDLRRWSIADPPIVRTPLSPIVAGAVLAVAGVFLGLPSALLLEFSAVLAMAGMALIIARRPVGPDPTVEASITLQRSTCAEPGQTLAGCHVHDHSAAGMKRAITVTE